MKKIKNNLKNIIAFIIGIILASTTVYGATIVLQGSNVGYDNTNSGFKDSNNNDVENVQTAIDELYTKASNKECKSGYVKTNETTDEYTCENPYTMSKMCPGCVFAKYTSEHYIQSTGNTPNTLSDVTTTSDYTTLNSNYFLGHILENGYIKRSFACGIENGEAFCLEGKDTSKYSNNIDILNHFFPNCNASSSGSYALCYGSSLYSTRANSNGYVNVTAMFGSSFCSFYRDGYSLCN